jgi:hypothetical protein
MNFMKFGLIAFFALAFFLFAGGMDDWEKEKPYAHNFTLRADEGWAEHSDNVSMFDYRPTYDNHETDLALRYNYGGHSYYTYNRYASVLGWPYAWDTQVDYPLVLAAKNNSTYQDGIFLEKSFLQEDSSNIMHVYVIILNGNVVYAYHPEGYTAAGYDERLVNRGDGTITAYYTPSLWAYFLDLIVPGWILFALIIWVGLFLIGSLVKREGETLNY